MSTSTSSSTSTTRMPMSTTTSPSYNNSIIPLADESFEVTKVDVMTGKFQTVCLTPYELLQQTKSILPRDLVSLALTSRERRRSSASSSSRHKQRRKQSNHNKKQQQQHSDAESSSRLRQLGSSSSPQSSSSSPSTLSVDLASWRHPPAILPREDCILVSFGHVRAVAERETIFLFDAGSSESHSKMANAFSIQLSNIYRERRAMAYETNMTKEQEGGTTTNEEEEEDALSSSSTTSRNLPRECFSVVFQHLHEEPPELVFLEAALSDVVDSFSRRIQILSPIVDDIVSGSEDQLEDVNDGVVVHQLAPLREQLQSLEVFITQAYECLTTLLNDDEEMLKCLLTEKDKARRSQIPVDFEKHTQVEILLGLYTRSFSSLLQEVNYLLSRLQSKQEYIALELALYRNRLIRMNVTLGILAAATGITTAVTGTFGMNLISGLEESAIAFGVVSGGSAVTAVGLAYGLHHVVSGKAVQKRAAARMEEINVLSSALHDMTALDYTVKKIANGTMKMDKATFKEELMKARHSRFVSDEEVDLLFSVLNANKDNFLDYEDFEMDFEDHDVDEKRKL